jgi:Tfp pilus assembly protein PilO
VSARAPFWRRRLLPAFLALAALNLLVFAGWTAPRTVRLRTATARLEAAREAVRGERAEVARLAERGEAIRANAADIKRFYSSVVGPEVTDLVPTLEDIDGMVRTLGLSTGPRAYKRDDVLDAAVERVAVTLPLEGSYEQLVGFLREVETSSRFLTVDRIALSGKEEGGALQVELSAYMRLPPGALVRRGGGGGR